MAERVAAGAGTSWSAVDETVTADIAVTVVERAREGEDCEDGGDDPRAEERAQEVAPGTGRHGDHSAAGAQSSVNPPRVGSRAWPRESGGRSHRSWAPTIRGASPTPASRSSRSTRRTTSPASCELGEPGEFPYTRGAAREMYRKQLWTMRQYAGYASAKESNERYKYLLAHGSTGPVDGVRPADPARPGLRRPALPRRGRPHRRRDRHDRRHAHRVRRDPARPGLHVDDDQRAGRGAAAALPARRRGAGRPARAAARHDAERRAQGVHRARELHLPAGAVDAPDDRPVRLLRARTSRSGTRSRSPATTSARRAARPCRRSPSRWPTASPTCRPRVDAGPGRRRLRAAPGVLLQRPQQRLPGGREVPRRPADVGARSCATASARTDPKVA